MTDDQAGKELDPYRIDKKSKDADRTLMIVMVALILFCFSCFIGFSRIGTVVDHANFTSGPDRKAP
ncbi:MAG: hypothetical protein K8F91_03730 [Candidatus Obscuribacterales bacterium]|nr:hypothetical protein [Candidatus Obscuribacterales bacterium]